MTKQTKLITVGAAIAALYLFRSKLSGGPVASVTTSEGFDLSEYGGPVSYPAGIKRMAEAIARQEGFYKSGSIPQRANNPGDLKVPGWTGPTLGTGITVFNSVDDGWQALYRQLWRILTNQSAYYNLDMTIAEMGGVWTATQQDAWSSNVAGFLGVPTSTKLWEVLA